MTGSSESGSGQADADREKRPWERICVVGLRYVGLVDTRGAWRGI